MKYKEWLEEWLKNYIEPTTKNKTFTRYSDIIRIHIIPKLGNSDMDELAPKVLQKFITELLKNGNSKTGEGLSVNTVNGIINVIQNSLRTSFHLGYTQNYTADRIKRPKPVEKEIKCFSLSEQKAIEEAVMGSKKEKMFGIVLCLYTGLRIGELLALRWEDIDLYKGTLNVFHACHDGKGKDGKYLRIEDTPKTRSSRRMIPLPKQLLVFLKQMKKQSISCYVISNKGCPISVRSYQRSFELLQNKLGIPHRGFHSLRHTFATRAIECGMDIKTLSEILGHKSATVTLNRYAHSLLEHKQEMMNRIGKLLK